MPAQLELVEPVVQWKRWLIPADRKLSIGRAPENTARPEVHGVSRNHARVRFSVKRNSWLIRDLDSRNGTFLNGERVSGRVVLRNGDSIRVGGATFKFSVL